jgi:hypothetical protein
VNINVRFFIYDLESAEVDLKEVNEQEFLETGGEIKYNRSTVFENGVSQIELTKENY